MGPAKDKHQAPINGLKLTSGMSLSLRPDPAINRDWVYNQACRLLHIINAVSHSFITFDYLFKLITKITSLANNSFKFIN